MRRKLSALILGLLLLGSLPAGATEYDVVPGVTVVGWDRLSTEAQVLLPRMLNTWPRALTPWLRVVTIDGAVIPEPLASDICAPNGEVLYRGPCGFNVWSSMVGGENPFPPDAPESVWVNGFIAVVTHEYGHQIGHGTSVEQTWVEGMWRFASDPCCTEENRPNANG